MTIEVNNKAQIANKYLRLSKWKLYRLKAKFSDLVYAKIFIQKSGRRNESIEFTLLLGIPGNNIILKERSNSIPTLVNVITKNAHRYLNKKNQKQLIY